MFVATLIDREKVSVILSGKKRSLFQRRKKILKTELVYLPVYVFSISTEDGRNIQNSQKVSVDGLVGDYSAYGSPELADRSSETDELPSFMIEEFAARKIAESEFRRIILRLNMRNGKKIRLVSCSEGIRIYYPYWIGYYKRGSGLDFIAVDAVSGEIQGVRMKPVLISLILQISGNKENERI